MATIAELKKQAAKAADEAVETTAKIRDIYTDTEVLKNAEKLEEKAINKATEAEEAEKKTDVETATEEALKAVEELNSILIDANIAKNDMQMMSKEEMTAVEEETPKEKIKNYIYVGPTLKTLGVKESTIYRGTKEDVYKHLENAIKTKPLIKNFIVSAEEASEIIMKVKTKGNAFYNMFEELKNKGGM